MVLAVIRPMCFTPTLSRLFFSLSVPQCCVFPAAVVLLDSWEVLLRNLWDEHLNHSLIRDIKQTLDKIIRRNKNAEVGFSFPNPIKYVLIAPFHLPVISAPSPSGLCA